MVEAALQALTDARLNANALVVLGPFMDEAKRAQFKRRCRAAPNLSALDYHPRIENLMVDAAGLVTMGGYNTFCEILSFDRPAILLPRATPRAEQ